MSGDAQTDQAPQQQQQQQVDGEGDDEADYEVPDEMEEVIEELLTGLRSSETIIRWSAAKGCPFLFRFLSKNGMPLNQDFE